MLHLMGWSLEFRAIKCFCATLENPGLNKPKKTETGSSPGINKADVKSASL